MQIEVVSTAAPVTLSIDGSTSSTKQQLQTFSFTGANYTPNGSVTRRVRQPNGSEISLGALSADGSGNISWSYTSVCTTSTGTYILWAVDDATGRTSNTVTEIITANSTCALVPALTLTLTGCTTCRAGDRFTVQAHVTNPGSRDVLVEAKIGVSLPDGTPVNVMGNKHLEVTLSAGFDKTFILLDTPLPAGLPTGTWSVEGTLVGPEPGETFSREVKSFTVVP